MLASGLPLFVFGVNSWVIWIILWLVFLFSFLVLYILAGHALIYGPHLFVFGFLDLASAPFQVFKTETVETDVDDDAD